MVTRAPSRGKYDRSASASQRAQDQRHLILNAAERLLGARGEPATAFTVSDLCTTTGLGRNTIYGQFASAESVAREAIIASTEALLRGASGPPVATTPLESVNTFAKRWIEAAAARPSGTGIALAWSRDELVGHLTDRLGQVIQGGIDAGMFAVDSDGQRLRILVAACLGAAELASRHPADAGGLSRLLADLLLKAAR
jgi:AcrR family transcriptional regulator